MPEKEDQESGLDELMRLQRQFSRQQEENEAQERQREAQGKKVRGVLQGLKDLNVSMSVNQLKTVAPPDIVREVDSLKQKESTEDLRKLISRLADDLEKRITDISSPDPALANAMRTLTILMDLYFSLQQS
jgi:predicted component of type VI protein secretion system